MISKRLLAIVEALPLEPGIRVLEIGCGPGAAARAVATRLCGGYVLAIDRSAKAIAQARRSGADKIASGHLGVRQVSVEEFTLEPGEAPYNLAFAVRIGVLDGRHPARAEQALRQIATALTADGRLFIDGGDPLREISLHEYR